MNKIAIAFLTLGLLHCGAQVEEPRQLPRYCRLQTEYAHSVLCYNHDYGIFCGYLDPPNPDPERCTGLEYMTWVQYTGNDWCCNGVPNYVEKQ